MIIAVTGYGNTGASAYCDLISEFEGIQGFPAEFPFLYLADGLLDLEDAIATGNRLKIQIELMRFKNNIDIERTKYYNRWTKGKFVEETKKFFDKIADVRWIGESYISDPVDVLPWHQKKKYKILRELIKAVMFCFGRAKKWPKFDERYFTSLSKQEYIDCAKDYLEKIFSMFDLDLKKPIMIEQVFNPANALAGFEFFEDDVLSIFVDRDPRDLYILTNYSIPQFSRFMPCNGNVEDFVKYYRSIHKNHIADPRVKYVFFEDLIYKYDSTLEQVSEWVNHLNHVHKGEFFKPQYSINNTQLWKRYPRYAKEVEYIEKNMADMLYDFDSVSSALPFEVVNVRPFHNQRDND